MNLHDINFLDAIKAYRGLYELPHEIVIIGIEPGMLECGLGLSDELNKVLPDVIEAARKELV